MSICCPPIFGLQATLQKDLHTITPLYRKDTDVFVGKQTWSDYVSAKDIVKGIDRSIVTQTKGISKPVLDLTLTQRDQRLMFEAGLGAIDMGLASLQRGQASLADKTEAGLDRLADGLDKLNADFHLLLGDVIWKLEMQQETLLGILQEIRLAEFEREARAYRIRGEDSYLNGWYEQALADFIEAEKRNYKDFAVLRSIANIYLYHIVDLPKALQYFSAAAKYARPTAAHQAAEAEFFAGIVCGLQRQFDEGFNHFKRATDLNLSFYEAHYMQSAFAALLEDAGVSLMSLGIAISGDLRYFTRAEADKLFEKIRPQVSSFLERLRLGEEKNAKEALDSLGNAIDLARGEGASNKELSAYVDRYTEFNKLLESKNVHTYRRVTLDAPDWTRKSLALALNILEKHATDKRSFIVEHQAAIKPLKNLFETLKEQDKAMVVNAKAGSIGTILLTVLFMPALPLSVYLLFASSPPKWSKHYAAIVHLAAVVAIVLCSVVITKARDKRSAQDERHEIDHQIKKTSSEVEALNQEITSEEKALDSIVGKSNHVKRLLSALGMTS